MNGMGWAHGWRGAVRHLLGDQGGWIQLALMGGMALANALGKNKAKNREQQNATAMSQDQIKNDQYRTQQQALLQALGLQSNEQINQGALDLRQRQHNDKSVLLGSLLQNLQPVQFSGLNPQIASRMPQITGGLSPAALSPQARQHGGTMQAQGIAGNQAKGVMPQLQQTNFLKGLLQAPSLSGYKGPGKFESILGLLGAAGEAYGAYGGGNQGGAKMNNSMPSAYSGLDRYGNAANWTLPRNVPLGGGVLDDASIASLLGGG
jgi:hypothetical protein